LYHNNALTIYTVLHLEAMFELFVYTNVNNSCVEQIVYATMLVF